MGHLNKPGANARPARNTRSQVYPAFQKTGPDQPVKGTKPIYLYLRLSKYHKDKADAIERQRIGDCRMDRWHLIWLARMAAWKDVHHARSLPPGVPRRRRARGPVP